EPKTKLASYSFSDDTVFITGPVDHDHPQGGTFQVGPFTTITLNTKPTDASLRQSILSSKLEVVHVGFQPKARGKEVLSSVDLRDIPRQISPEKARGFLLGACILEFAVILLIVIIA